MKLLGVLLTVFILAASAASFAGNDGHGAGEVARLLESSIHDVLPDIIVRVTAQSADIRDVPEIAKAWAKARVLIAVNLDSVKTQMTSVHLRDRYGNNSTWIMTKAFPGAIIFFNPGDYDKTIKMDASLAKLSDADRITLYLLHELGHQYYSSDELKAWEFARVVLKSYIDMQGHEVVQARNQAGVCKVWAYAGPWGGSASGAQQASYSLYVHREEVATIVGGMFENRAAFYSRMTEMVKEAHQNQMCHGFYLVDGDNPIIIKQFGDPGGKFQKFLSY